MKRSIVSVPVQRAGKPGSDQDLLGRDAIASVTPGDNSITVTLAGEASIDLSA